MGRETVQMKTKRRRRDLTKTRCNFCEFSSSRYGSSSEESLQEQDNEAVLRKEVERLRLLINFTELQALESHLTDARRIVVHQKEKIKLKEDERLRKQKKEAEDVDDGTRRGVLVPSSSEGIQEKQDFRAPLLNMKRKFETRNAESLQSEFDRLWLLNERLNGRELEGMTSFDLVCLHIRILRALMALCNQKMGPRMELIARQHKEFVCHNNKELPERERCSLGNDKNDASILVFVSRKLRRFRNRYHQKK